MVVLPEVDATTTAVDPEPAAPSTTEATPTTVEAVVEGPVFESPPGACPEPEEKYRPNNVVVEELQTAGDLNLAGPTIGLTPRPGLGAVLSGGFARAGVARHRQRRRRVSHTDREYR